jgi:hypothetical protein
VTTGSRLTRIACEAGLQGEDAKPVEPVVLPVRPPFVIPGGPARENLALARLRVLEGVPQLADASVLGLDSAIPSLELGRRVGVERVHQRPPRVQSQEVGGHVADAVLAGGIRLAHDLDQMGNGVVAEVFELLLGSDPLGGRGGIGPRDDPYGARDVARVEGEAGIEQHRLVEMELLPEDPVRLLGPLAPDVRGEVGPLLRRAGPSRREIEHQEQHQGDSDEGRNHDQQPSDDVGPHPALFPRAFRVSCFAPYE